MRYELFADRTQLNIVNPSAAEPLYFRLVEFGWTARKKLLLARQYLKITFS